MRNAIELLGAAGISTAVAAMIMLTGCQKKEIPATGVKISSTARIVKIDSTITLSCAVEPEGAKVESTVWKSSSDAVATVDQSGVVKGIDEGTAYVTVTLNGQFSATCTVTVKKPVLLPGTFSVSASKQVRFTKGNLYWDGDAWNVELVQTDYPATWDPAHVGHFFWTKSADKSYMASYGDGICRASDIFFVGGSDADHKITVEDQGGLYALSADEWKYLLSASPSGRGDGNSYFRKNVTVNGIGTCLVIAPDNYSGSIEASYDAAGWKKADRAGLVALPACGKREGTTVTSGGSEGLFWSATQHEYNASYACCLNFKDISIAASNIGNRNCGYAIRLVSDVRR